MRPARVESLAKRKQVPERARERERESRLHGRSNINLLRAGQSISASVCLSVYRQSVRQPVSQSLGRPVCLCARRVWARVARLNDEIECWLRLVCVGR